MRSRIELKAKDERTTSLSSAQPESKPTAQGTIEIKNPDANHSASYLIIMEITTETLCQ